MLSRANISDVRLLKDRALAELREHWSVMGLAFAICTSRDFQREGSSVFPRHGFNVG